MTLNIELSKPNKNKSIKTNAHFKYNSFSIYTSLYSYCLFILFDDVQIENVTIRISEYISKGKGIKTRANSDKPNETHTIYIHSIEITMGHSINVNK